MKSFLVLGLGRFGTSIAKTLSSLGCEVMGVDRNMERVKNVLGFIGNAVQANTADENAMAELGVSDYDCVIISASGDIKSSVLTTVLCKENGAKYLICKASDDLHAKILEKVGADRVVMPEKDSGERLARTLVSKYITDYIELSDEFTISEFVVPKEWVGKDLVSLQVRNKYGISVVAVRNDEDISLTIDPYRKIEKDDVFVALGSYDSFRKIEKMRR